MSEYQLTANGSIIRTSDSACIPADPDNRDYAEYLVYVANGGAIDAYVPPPAPVPSSISDRQFFQQLAVLGVISEADALASNAAVIPPPLLDIINKMPKENQFAAKMLISGATVFERGHPMTIAIGGAYGWTPEQIDQFFIVAAAL